MKKNRFISFLLLMTMSLGVLCSCGGEQGPIGPQGEQGPIGPQGEQGQPGKDGENGHTPEVTIGENGNWCVDGVDTGVSAKGENGDNGKSAYELYLKSHPEYNKTEEEWLNELVNGTLVSKCNVTFDTDGGTTIQSQEVKYGSTITMPDEPIKKGYVFGGWYLEEEFLKGDNENMISWQFPYYTVSKDIVLKAKWIKDDHLYFTKFVSKEEWNNAFDIENGTISIDAKEEYGEEVFEVNDVICKILDGHWFSNYENANEWTCFKEIYEIFDQRNSYDKFLYNGDYCYYTFENNEYNLDVKVFLNNRKQITKFDMLSTGYSSAKESSYYSFEFSNYGTTEKPANVILETYEEVIMEGNQEYNVIFCSRCDGIVSKTQKGSAELFKEFVSEEEWETAFTHDNYTMVYDFKEGYYKATNTTYRIVGDYIYSNCNSNEIDCYNKSNYSNLSLFIHDIIYNGLDYSYYVLRAYDDYKYNGEYCYSRLEFDNYDVIIKVYFNEDKLINKIIADIENINYPSIEIMASFDLYDYNITQAPTLVHDYYSNNKSYEGNLIADIYCQNCSEHKTIEYSEEISNAIKLAKANDDWSYGYYTTDDGIIVENYLSFSYGYTYQVQYKDGKIIEEWMWNYSEMLGYYHESGKYEYDYYGYSSQSIADTDNWLKISSLLYNNFEKFEVIENEHFNPEDDWVVLATYNEDVLTSFTGTYDYKNYFENLFSEAGLEVTLLAPFYLGIAFQVKDGVIANTHIIYPTIEGIYYSTYGHYCSEDEFVSRKEDILIAYKRMYAEIQERNIQN